MSTLHNEANIGDIAPLVIMPGDPLRAKMIAEKYLENAVLVNKVRNMLCYTGYYKGVRISVMGSGMGMPSMGLYSYELFKFYDVDIIIRVGSCGVYDAKFDLFDLLVVDAAYTEGNFALNMAGEKADTVSANIEVTNKIKETADNNGIKIESGTIVTGECFDPYMNMEAFLERLPKNKNIIGAEMEAFALLYTAKTLNKKAACIVTVADSHAKDKKGKVVASVEEREKSLYKMIELALDSIITFNK